MTSVRVLLSVCAVCAMAAAALATPMPFPAEGQPVDDKVAPVAPAEVAPPPTLSERQPLDMDSEDLGRKKKIKKGNSTIGEEVLGAIVDGLSGESEDAKFGSEIRQEFGFLIDAVANLSVATINKYASSRAAEPMAVGGQDHARTARAVDNVGEGRRRQVRRLLVRYLVLLKVFALGIILPGAVLLSLLQSWKAVTLSLMALLLAGVIGLRGLVSTAAKGQAAEVIHTTGPGGGGHYWRRVSSPEAGQEPDRLAYSAYVPAS